MPHTEFTESSSPPFAEEFVRFRNLGLSTVVAFLAIFILSTIWNEVVVDNQFLQAFELPARSEQRTAIVAGHVLLALMMAYMYPIGYSGASPWKEGMRFGALLGAVTMLPLALTFYGVMETALLGLLVDAAWHIIMLGTAGILIGLTYGESSREAAEEYVKVATNNQVIRHWQPRYWQDPNTRYTPALVAPAPAMISRKTGESEEKTIQ
jgi:hypothetical protein